MCPTILVRSPKWISIGLSHSASSSYWVAPVPLRVIASATDIRSDRRLEKIDGSRVGFNLTLRHPPTILFLVSGGWYAPELAKPRTLLLDRNVLDRLVRYARGIGRIHDQPSVEALLRS